VTAFVDTSVFYAAADSGDRDHVVGAALLRAEPGLLTTDHVLIETWHLLNARLGPDRAEAWWSAIRAGVASVEPVGLVDLEAAWAIGQAFPDQDFSIVDRTSFAVMERLGITRALSFDSDFLVYRFGPRRARAFEVVR
jgi:predicted nucleic acid-binding protein